MSYVWRHDIHVCTHSEIDTSIPYYVTCCLEWCTVLNHSCRLLQCFQTIFFPLQSFFSFTPHFVYYLVSMCMKMRVITCNEWFFLLSYMCFIIVYYCCIHTVLMCATICIHVLYCTSKIIYTPRHMAPHTKMYWSEFVFVFLLLAAIVIEFCVRILTVFFPPMLKAIFYHSMLVLMAAIIIARYYHG